MQPEGMPDMGAILQQAQQMQEGLARAQEELAQAKVEGSAGGGLVKVQMTGTSDIVGVEIDPTVVDPEDVESLQDLVVAAVRDATARAAELTQQKMGGLTGGMGGLGLPGL
ncbi:MAG: YbaB/EbfC family nucleoid-associated protein [Cumulibacter sp.]|uniref:YbaB/EbfC family nucleoid-associated protein n=1 Tax=Cumulibacter soli TaxID=2546344 RepID=UPI001067D258|nr:YbaB/EbfC family nucleoid-associated protein [Cumulibacter soli]